MKTIMTSALSTLLLLLPLSSLADYTTDKGAIVFYDEELGSYQHQDIVITFSQNLGKLRWDGSLKWVNPKSVEKACLALTLGQFLRMNQNVNVTLFVRNDGVKLADSDLVSAISDWQQRRGRECQNPMGMGRLDVLLGGFLDGEDNNLVNCPICWCEYRPDTCPPEGEVGPVSYDDFPGVINDPEAIPRLFLGAEKIIDF